MTATRAPSATGELLVLAGYGDQAARRALGDVTAVVPAADDDAVDRGVRRLSRTGEVGGDGRDRQHPPARRDEPSGGITAGAGVDDGDAVDRVGGVDTFDDIAGRGRGRVAVAGHDDGDG